MIDIKVRRYQDHPHKYQGSILPEDNRWKLVIDEDGVPHLFVRVFLDDEHNQSGWLGIEDLLPSNEKTGEPLMISDLIDGVAEGEMNPEEEQAAYDEYMARPHFCPGND